jgi:hypothetical protein
MGGDYSNNRRRGIQPLEVEPQIELVEEEVRTVEPEVGT